MANIDRAYVSIALAWLIAGMILGLYMGASTDNEYLDVHVAMLLGGFVVLVVYGVLYRLWPALKEGAVAKIQFWVAAAGSLGLVIGAALIVNQMGIAVAAVSSVLAIIGAILMAVQFWTRAGI